MTEEALSTVTPVPGTVPGEHQPPKLLDRVRIAIRTRHYSLRTKKAYVGWIRRFIFFHNKRHAQEMGEPEINTFLSHLAVKAHVSASTQNQALCALVFLYRRVLEKPFPDLERLVRAKRTKRLPVVMTHAEVKAVPSRLHGTSKLVATLLYGTGMRLMECLRLRVKDVEFGRNLTTVREGKGDRDRRVPLPAVTRQDLASWLSQVKRIHESDIAEGFGSVYMPYALERKYPGASLQWGWQWLLRGFLSCNVPCGREIPLFCSAPWPGSKVAEFVTFAPPIRCPNSCWAAITASGRQDIARDRHA